MHKREDFHHTPEQVIGYVRAALAIHEECSMEEDEWIALLPTLVTLLSSKQIFYEQAGPIPNLALPGSARH